jgi:xyloglucan 6-xylosyltransferase
VEQAEWIWWLDADAVITDLSFEPPYAEHEGQNLILYGEDRRVYDKRTWKGLSTANFLIRNCQWSLDLLDTWASMGTADAREESGKFLSGFLGDRPFGFPGDDQAGLVALLAQDKRESIGKRRWAPLVKLVKETEYAMNANWAVVGPRLEELSLEKKEVPFVTHFTGCLPACNVKPEMPENFLSDCVKQLGRAFDFSDNQVRAFWNCRLIPLPCDFSKNCPSFL